MKITVTILYIVAVVSFGKYDLAALLPFLAYPVVIMVLGEVPTDFIIKKVLLAAPFAIFMGAFNLFWDRNVLLHLGQIPITGGFLSFGSILLRFVLTVTAALILIGTTGFTAVGAALERMGVPSGFVVQLLFLYRYIFVLADEASRMMRARALRTFGNRGMGVRVASSMIGLLLLRTLDRAQRIHLAMLCRGFDGEVRLLRPMRITRGDLAFLAGWAGFFALARLFNLPQLIGNLVTRLAS